MNETTNKKQYMPLVGAAGIGSMLRFRNHYRIVGNDHRLAEWLRIK